MHPKVYVSFFKHTTFFEAKTKVQVYSAGSEQNEYCSDDWYSMGDLQKGDFVQASTLDAFKDDYCGTTAPWWLTHKRNKRALLICDETETHSPVSLTYTGHLLFASRHPRHTKCPSRNLRDNNASSIVPLRHPANAMSGLEKSLFNLKFTAKQLNRQAQKAGKDEVAEKNKLKKAITQGHADIAKIYAQNAIRKQNEKLNLLRLQSRIDAVASRVQTAVTMRQVTGSMAQVVRGMEGAMKAMDLEKISAVMDKFETQFDDLDVATGYYENATSSATAVGTPQDDVEKLISMTADEAGVELNAEMKTPESGIAVGKVGPEEEREEGLGERLRALRN
ncbi:MAG: hypothetical protein Q9217_002153 [Psora testacea]